jgi:hypothetical protein
MIPDVPLREGGHETRFAAQEGRDSRNMQGLAHLQGHGLQELSAIRDRAHALAEVGQDVLRLHRLAEETAVDPEPEAVSPLLQEHHEEEGEPQTLQSIDLTLPGAGQEVAQRQDHEHSAHRLRDAERALRKRVLEPLADYHAHAHGLVHDHHVGQGEGEDEHHQDREPAHRVGTDRVPAPSGHKGYGGDDGHRGHADRGAGHEDAQPPQGIRVLSDAELEAQGGEEQRHRHIDQDEAKASGGPIQRDEGRGPGEAGDGEIHQGFEEARGQERAKDQPLQPGPLDIKPQSLGKNQREREHGERPSRSEERDPGRRRGSWDGAQAVEEDELRSGEGRSHRGA